MPSEPTHSKLLALTVHELRTPITIVSGYLRMLLGERAGPLSDQQRKLLEEAERSSNRLASLVGDLSDIANLQAGTAVFNNTELPIFQLVDEVTAQLSSQDGDRTIEVELRGNPPAAIVVADAHRLRSALIAICSAVLRDIIKADRFVVARSIRTDGDIAFAVLAVGDEASVADLMTPKRRPATFDEWRSGWGLSLVIARHVIEAHGGKLAAPRGQRAKSGAMMLLPTRGA